MSDLQLLRRFEPIMRFTKGELFFPRAVDQYVHASSLWELDVHKKAHLLIPENVLTLDQLAQYDTIPPGHVLYLRYVDEPLHPLEFQQWQSRLNGRRFQAPGRLTRVPLLSRIGDSFFNLSLAVRGTVPGGTAAAAEIKTRKLYGERGRDVYYGRIVREGEWIVLHYLFFFPMNDWRSGFHGVNDHEADWEQVLLYLYQQEDEEPQPVWVAFASHDFKGDDLRRRWDDPELHREGDHPIIYAGAGSHASYFKPGEYMMNIEPRFLTPVKTVLNGLRTFWYETLQQGDSEGAARRIDSLLSVPFVDYARGDGAAIGPGHPRSWSPVLISDADAWVDHYRGLWGLDTRDILGGERAPSGPKYNRDGTIRMSWYDPLGWAGVDKLLPPVVVPAALRRRIFQLDEELATLDEKLQSDLSELRLLALDVEALATTEYFSAMHKERAKELAGKQQGFQRAFAARTYRLETREALEDYLQRAESGDFGPPQAHVLHAHEPVPFLTEQRRAIEIWAAISGALALLSFGALLVFRPPHWVWWALVITVAFGAVDAWARGRTARFLLNAVITLAIIAGIILVMEFWRMIVIVLLVIVVISMMRDNLRELA